MINNGLCGCGCGSTTKIADKTQKRDGDIKGMPRRFVSGHQGRPHPKMYSVDENQCWIWNWSKNKGGYGRITISGKKILAHRYMYEIKKGEIGDIQLDHLCRKRDCVNPDHMDKVTNMVNTQRGRSAKLEGYKIDEIRSLRRNKTCTEIAKIFGISQGHVSDICNYKKWTNIGTDAKLPHFRRTLGQ